MQDFFFLSTSGKLELLNKQMHVVCYLSNFGFLLFKGEVL